MRITESDKQFTLLLVDDNPTNLLLLTKIIELDLPDVRVLTAKSAMEGLELSERERIDGAFIDVQMPHMSGLDMCRHLNDNPRTNGIPLVLMTAHLATPELRAEGLEVGAYDFISQPISNIEMLARIKVMLRLCANEQRARRNSQQLKQQVEDHSLRLRWISGLLISGDGPAAEPDQQLLQHLVAVLPDPAAMADQQLFDKLTSDLPLPWRRTLLKISLLDSVPVRLARELSEINDIEAVFAYLQRHELSLTQLVDGEDLLLFKPETRDFLRKKAERELDLKERRQVCLAAADWFQRYGNEAAALKCLISVKYYSAVSQLLNQYGLALFDKCSHAQLAVLIAEIPEDVAANCGWLAMFRGIYLFHQQEHDSIAWLELAYQLFHDAGHSRGQLLALSQQVLLTLYLDGFFERWSTRLDTLRRLMEQQASLLEIVERLKVSYALGLAELFFGGSLAPVEKLLEVSLVLAQHHQLAVQQMELNLLRSLLGLQQGRYLVARTALEQGFQFAGKIEQTVEHAVLQVVACEILQAFGDFKGLQLQMRLAKKAFSRDFRQSAFAPLLSYYKASLLLAHGERQRATELLDVAATDGPYAKNAHIQSRLLQMRGYLQALAGDDSKAVDSLESALALRQTAGGAFARLENLLFAAVTCAVLERLDQAADYLETGLAESLAAKEERYRAGFHAWAAFVQQKLGRPDEAEGHLRSLLDLMKRQKVHFFWSLMPELLTQLGQQVKENKVRVMLQSLLEKYLLVTFADKNQLIPLLKVYTLGRFQLELEHVSFDFSQVGQVPRQIFALLIAAPNHSMSLELIMSLLWPESSASKARNSLDAAHSRLRKALEDGFGAQVRDHYLVLEKGMLSLRHVWIDKNLVDQLMATARYQLQRGNNWQTELALWKIEELFQGEFLSGFDLAENLLGQREQLNQLRLEQVEMLAMLLKNRQQNAEAAKVLNQGLLLDPTRDSLIRQLLALYHDQQDHRSAGLLLEKYRTALTKEDYEADEIAELIDTLGVQWLALHLK